MNVCVLENVINKKFNSYINNIQKIIYIIINFKYFIYIKYFK